MIFIPFYTNVRPLLALLLGVFPHLLTTASAETLLLYDFEDTNGDFELSAEVRADGLELGDWSVINSTLRDFSGNPGRAIASGGFSSGNAFVLPINIADGQLLQLSRFGFEQSASASGPLSWALSIDDANVASGATSVGFQAISEDLALDGITGSFLLALSGDGASSNAGTYRIDNFFLEGSVSAVPLPGALVFFLSAGLGIMRYTRAGIQRQLS